MDVRSCLPVAGLSHLQTGDASVNTCGNVNTPPEGPPAPEPWTIVSFMVMSLASNKSIL